MLAVDLETYTISQASTNAPDVLGKPLEDILGSSIRSWLGPELLQALDLFEKTPLPEIIPSVIGDYLSKQDGTTYECLAHTHNGFLIVELEKTETTPASPNQLGLLKFALREAEKAETLQAFCHVAAQYVKMFTGYDRVMVYRFDTDGSGEVIAEAKEEHIEPFFGLHYPATDIPEPARRLLLKNAIRVIANVNQSPVPLHPLLNPKDGKPFDMSHCSLRAVSPIHIEYLQNMGVGATMTISIVVEGKLVGLIACHHYSPLYLPHATRNQCEFLSQAFSLQYRNYLNSDTIARRLKTEDISNQIIKTMQVKKSVRTGLLTEKELLLKIAEADGFVFKIDDSPTLSDGLIPTPEAIEALLQRLQEEKQSFCSTHAICDFFPQWAQYDKEIVGLLAIPLDPNWKQYCIWFRQKITKTIHWAGKPEKPKRMVNGELVLSPRSSFAKWEQKVEGISKHWEPALIQSVKKFVEINLKLHLEIEARKIAQEALKETSIHLAKSNSELQNFAYVASHDLQEPLRSIAGCLQVLKRRYPERLDERANQLIGLAVDSSVRMGTLIEDLLEYSRLENKNEMPVQVDTQATLEKVLTDLSVMIRENSAEITTQQTLPTITMVPSQCQQLFQNLISNAIKFRSEASPKIKISVKDEKKFWLFTFEDNGIGVEKKYYEKIFVIFQRLHTQDEFAGNGIGLSLCKKIIENHRGNIWITQAESLSGTAFHFTLPRN